MAPPTCGGYPSCHPASLHQGVEVLAAYTPDMTDIAQLNADRQPNGQFGMHQRKHPEIELDGIEAGDYDEESTTLFSFDYEGELYEVLHESGSLFSVYRLGESMTFLKNFTFTGDHEDHHEIEDAARDSL